MALAVKRQRMIPYGSTDKPLADTPVPSDKPADHVLDSTLNQDEFRKLQEWWLQARETQALVRLEMDVDDNFYHGDQFTQEDRQALMDVGQAPLVFNKIKPVIDWLIGTERRTRVDFNVLPRKRGGEDAAQMKKDVLKFISDTSKAPFARSEAFKEAVISGLSWIETGVLANEQDSPVYIRHESWRNMWYDALGTSKDTSDWRYQFRSKWTDLDIAQAMFPDRARELENCSNSVGIDLTTKDDDEFYIGLRYSSRDRTGAYIGLPSYTEQISSQVNNRRERVRLVECWYRMPVKGQKVKGGKHHGRNVNLRNQRMMFELNADVAAGRASVYDAVVMRVKCAVFCENVLLQLMDSPYHHNRLPFVPVWGYRKGKFHEPYGAVRNCRDPQEDLNKRYSKALFLLSSTRIIADRNAIQDWEAIRTEVGRPDAQLLLDKKDARFEIHQETALAEEQVKLMQNDGIHIMESGGVTPENLGRDTNAMSGKAVLAKQTQGSVVSAELFDNQRLSVQLEGELTLSLAEQFIDQPMAVRITGERGEVQWRDVNNAGADGQTLNDITATQMDFIVSEQDFRDTMRQAMFETLGDMLSKMQPEVALNMLDAVIDLTDFPGKKELIDRIRKINGQLPPAAQMSDEQKKEAQGVMAEQQKQSQLKEQAVMLELEEKKAKIAKINADAKEKLSRISKNDGGAAVEQARAQLQDTQKRAAMAEMALNGKIAMLTTKLADRSAEIQANARVTLEAERMSLAVRREEAGIKADTAIHVAEISAGVDYELGMDELNQEIASLEGKLAQKSEAAKAPAKKSLARKKKAA